MNPYQSPPAAVDDADRVAVRQEIARQPREHTAEAAALGASLGAVAGWGVLSFFDLGTWLFQQGAMPAAITVAIAIFYLKRKQSPRRHSAA